MDTTRISTEHLQVIRKESTRALNFFINKSQDVLIRFVFCGVEKLNKVAQSIQLVYSHLDTNEDLEFSIGILVRSIMMDCMLVQRIKHTIFTYVQNNPAWTKEAISLEVKELCYKFISDGTDNFIKEIYDSTHLTEEQKRTSAEKFAKHFPKAFDLSHPKPKLIPGYKVVLKNMHVEATHPDLVSKESVYNLYTYYSKYDHLSHWTSAASKLPFEHRKGKIDLAIVLILMQLRDLLVLAYDFDPSYSSLEPVLQTLQSHLVKEYDPEINKEPLA